MTGRLTQRSWWSTFSIALIGFLMLSLVAACGSDDGDYDDADTSTTTTATTSSGSMNTTDAATEDDTAGTAGMGDAMAIGLCLQESTTGDIVTGLRDGNTEGAENMYRDCLGDALPESMVSQLDPIIEQAGTCGSDAAADLSDDEVAAIEEGDQAAVEQVTNETLECLSAELGVDLQ